MRSALRRAIVFAMSFLKNGVQVLKRLSDDNSLKVHAHDPALREALDAAEEVMDENRKLLRELK